MMGRGVSAFVLEKRLPGKLAKKIHNLAVDLHVSIVVADPLHPYLEAASPQDRIVQEFVCNIRIKKG